ncbi:peptidylprolyl isomerase [Kiloniella laminariae]|uniref:Parvulin-like PPIase n=1 Tax=Kiloniella laminariae TaxID=454162 RepID=A0ABT4LM45_9PROT|nr:peptidylprolyl isomerase [Kiloniella laminariae]MCZ4282168.1 peptidylprolyl isomerase [Kiloniella laminariae]
MSAKQILFPIIGGVALLGAAYAGYSYGAHGDSWSSMFSGTPAETVSADDPLMARVGEMEIRRSEVLKFAESIPNIPQAQIEMILPELLDQVIDLKLITKEAEASNLARDPEVLKRLSEVKERVLVQTYLDRALKAEVSDEAVEQAYQDYLVANPPVKEVSARHILVEDEETAKGLIKELDEGADFAELATQKSTGPSGPTGGDLGFFRKEQMVGPFAEAAFTMKPGEHSSTPVQTQFGWHVIKVEAERDSEQPTAEQLDGQLRSELSQKAYETIVSNLKSGVEIEIIGAEAEESAPVDAEEAPVNEEAPADAEAPVSE